MSVPALLPLARTGYPHTGDGILHLFRTALLNYHIRHGVLYPRWLPELMLGQGYPVLGYYAPGMYYLAELFVLPGLSVDAGLTIACGLAMILGGIGAYLLARDLFGEGSTWPAAAAAVAYIYSPYLLTNLYVRGAIAEFGANALLPWVFWTFRRLVSGSRPDRYLLPASLVLGGLAITHNITLLLVPPVLGVYVMIVWAQHSRDHVRLVWAGGALAAAMAISAWFWLPLIGERSFLSTNAYRSSHDILAGQYWTWSNFLQPDFPYRYHADPPFQLGLVQIALAGAGAVLVRRRDPEWLFFIAVAVVAGIFAGAWAAPIWSNSQTMLVVQFPWRMLTLISLPLALLAGALLLRFRVRGFRAVGGMALLALLLVSNYPRTEDFQAAVPEHTDIGLPVIAQAEPELSPGTTYSREFHPRWLDEMDGNGAIEPQALDGQVAVLQAGSHRIELSVDSTAGGALRLPQFYFPGWSARVDGLAAPLYATSPQALATVDVAPGVHTVSLAWEGTALQRWGGIASLAGLLALVVYCILTRGFLPGLLPAALAAFGYYAMLMQGGTTAAAVPDLNPSPGIHLAGARWEQAQPQEIYIFPYWHIETPPAESLRIRWRLLAADGATLAETVSGPYYGLREWGGWPAGSLVQDAYRMPLPPGLAAGDYRLSATPLPDGQPEVILGQVRLVEPVPPEPEIIPTHVLDLKVGIAVRLLGYDVVTPGQAGELPLAQGGDTVAVTLFWRPVEDVPENYGGFVHLIDRAGEPLARVDGMPGRMFRPPTLWDRYRTEPARYDLILPPGAPGGLYWPAIGLNNGEKIRLPIWDAPGKYLGDTYRLPPIKVIGPVPPEPQHPVGTRLGEFAELIGYDLEPDADTIAAGQTLTLTLQYRSLAPLTADYTRFVQLRGDSMAAQTDEPPAGGSNPTSAWVPGEVVIDRTALQISPSAQPGQYKLAIGMYDRKANNRRVPLLDKDGKELPDDELILRSLVVAP